ncbi:hypothetical protein [Nocardia barduliensis]|nr:hypothetical protein [Nocardia barduliensis]
MVAQALDAKGTVEIVERLAQAKSRPKDYEVRPHGLDGETL